MEDGEAGPLLLRWLNTLPEVQAVLQEKFGGEPIKQQNLSNWRQAGFARWQRLQQELAFARTLTEEAKAIQGAAGADALAERIEPHLALALARVLRDAEAGAEGPEKTRAILGVACELARLRRSNQAAQRLKLTLEDRADAKEKARVAELRALAEEEFEAVDPDRLRRIRKLKEVYDTFAAREKKLREAGEPIPDGLTKILKGYAEVDQIFRDWVEVARRKSWVRLAERRQMDEKMRKASEAMPPALRAILRDDCEYYFSLPEAERHRVLRSIAEDKKAEPARRKSGRNKQKQAKTSMEKITPRPEAAPAQSPVVEPSHEIPPEVNQTQSNLIKP